MIGVFWIYDNQIFCETQNIKDIKPINGFIDSDLAHYQVWDSVKNQHPKFYLYEYEDIPRGRVVYYIEENQFIIYCNENILKQDISKKLILDKFQLLSKNFIFKKDEHYKLFDKIGLI
jgi:hypothetical protein